MRAREFITEQYVLPDEIANPMDLTYVIPGLSAQDPYRTYRFGVAIAQARSEAGKDKDKSEFSEESAFGENAVVVGFDNSDNAVIDRALSLTQTEGGKIAVAKTGSKEPQNTNTKSPINSFKGYPR